MNGSELTLRNAERFGLVLARSQETTGQAQKLSRPNIGKVIGTPYRPGLPPLI